MGDLHIQLPSTDVHLQFGADQEKLLKSRYDWYFIIKVNLKSIRLFSEKSIIGFFS